MEHINYKDDAEIIPEYPTTEMNSRSRSISIISNIIICMLGGLLLLNTYMNNNISYVIGISICMAFIVPIVNTGMLLYMEEYDKSLKSFMVFLAGCISLIFSTSTFPFFSFMYS